MAKLTDLLVVADIDGTLLQAGYGMPRENIDAIERFVDKNGKFAVCTGRSVVAVRRYIDWIQPTAPCILNNGTLIYDFKKEKVLFNVNLDDSVLEIIKNILSTFPDIGVELHSTEGITVVRQTEYTQKRITVEHLPYTLEHITQTKGRWNKILLLGSTQRMKQLENYIEKNRKNNPMFVRFDFVASSDIYYEIIPAGVNKGTGLKKLAEIMKTDIKNTVAIGDYYNDIEMLEVAGYSAAVSDAPADVKAKVDITVSSCLQGGVGELLDSLEALCDGFEQLMMEI
jgi:HAD-superfamily hydrolase, subfamily IIB